MDPAEPDGITSAPTPHPNPHPSSAPPGAVTKGRLQSLEQNLLVLERNYGATHPQVILSIIRLPYGLLHNDLCCVIKAAISSGIFQNEMLSSCAMGCVRLPTFVFENEDFMQKAVKH